MTLQHEKRKFRDEIEKLERKNKFDNKISKTIHCKFAEKEWYKETYNVKVIYEYIIAEQNEINIKESTKEGQNKMYNKIIELSKSQVISKYLQERCV